MNPRRCGVIKRVVIRSWIDFLPGVDDRRTIIVLKESVLKLKWGRRTSPSGKRAKHLAIKKLNKGISQRYNTHHSRVNQPLTCSEFGTFKGSNSLSIIDLIYPKIWKRSEKVPVVGVHLLIPTNQPAAGEVGMVAGESIMDPTQCWFRLNRLAPRFHYPPRKTLSLSSSFLHYISFRRGGFGERQWIKFRKKMVHPPNYLEIIGTCTIRIIERIPYGRDSSPN